MSFLKPSIGLRSCDFKSKSCFSGVLRYPGHAVVGEFDLDGAMLPWFLLVIFLHLPFAIWLSLVLAALAVSDCGLSVLEACTSGIPILSVHTGMWALLLEQLSLPNFLPERTGLQGVLTYRLAGQMSHSQRQQDHLTPEITRWQKASARTLPTETKATWHHPNAVLPQQQILDTPNTPEK